MTDKLNNLLANYQIYYQNLRGFHWNIKGRDFFELHELFEQLYTDAAVKIDEIAERILTLGDTPLHSYEAYLSESDLKPATDISASAQSMTLIYDAHEVLIGKMNDVMEIAGEKNDEGTADLISPIINQMQKTNWMIGAWLEK
ncbi:MAG TPA: DNA starvation/stationary phase protection protein [Flavobacteriales bacterium]|jgi:starvation-inducible DNA-binding protein|nr:DNA starvation/stationary phase protection protein [Flavobacteriales bacterium]